MGAQTSWKPPKMAEFEGLGIDTPQYRIWIFFSFFQMGLTIFNATTPSLGLFTDFLIDGWCISSISERWTSDQLTAVEHFSNIFVLTVGWVCYCTPQTHPKWWQTCWKSVQLVRGSFFRNDLLQNPYFSWMSETADMTFCNQCTRLAKR